jgi:hypothetical protein
MSLPIPYIILCISVNNFAIKFLPRNSSSFIYF